VGANHPTVAYSHRYPIPDRSDRRRVARDRAALAKAMRDGPAARVADGRDHQRHLLCHVGGLPMATAAERLAAMGAICRWFAAWRDDGRFERMNQALLMADRERVGRAASPSVAIVDSQSGKGAHPNGPVSRDSLKSRQQTVVSPRIVRGGWRHCCPKAPVGFRFARRRAIFLTVHGDGRSVRAADRYSRARQVYAPCAIMTSYPMDSSR